MKYLIAIPACRNLAYGPWESTQSPHFTPQGAYLGRGYGENIHISGPNERIQAIRDTWAKDVPPEMDLRFFYGLSPMETWYAEPNSVMLDCRDDYEHLPEKVFSIFRWALAEGYDWCFKTDDDAYCWPERLLAEIQWKQWHYGGYLAHSGSYVSGGPGYWVSRHAMEVVAASTPHTWAEDACVGESLRKSGIKAYQLNATHLCGLVDHWINPDTRDLTGAATAHAVRASDMYKIYAREHPTCA